MKFSLYLLLLFLPVLAIAQNVDEPNPNTGFSWNKEKAKEQAERFNDPENWNLESLKAEVEFFSNHEPPEYPLNMSPFPTPEYHTTGNGTKGIRLQIENKNIIGHAAFIKRGEHSEFLFTNQKDKEAIYFTILSLDDQIENPNPIVASSRNHPNYLAQGTLNTNSKSAVDWVAIQVADQNAYAVVNGKIFDLRVGRLILAAPQKDGSIRFFQTKLGPVSIEQLDTYLDNLNANKNLIEFFTREGNI